ncbi:MAG: hypothetical protein KBT03_09670 [Bacteroidales bacterium]|nr:hypothetical protein [Candidatus Scybalousia scybalohippi]
MKRPDEYRYELMLLCKNARKETGVSLSVVANLSGLSLQYLRNIECGYETISQRVVESYKQMVEIFTKNKKIKENQKNLLTLSLK